MLGGMHVDINVIIFPMKLIPLTYLPDFIIHMCHKILKIHFPKVLILAIPSKSYLFFMLPSECLPDVTVHLYQLKDF